MKPKIAVTMGDPAGVGPEIALRLLAHPEVAAYCTPIVFGDALLLRRVATQLNLPMCATIIDARRGADSLRALTEPAIYDLQAIEADAVTPGQISAACGQACYDYILAAIRAAEAGHVDAISTGPINKEALRAAGVHYPGHTEIFADETDSARICMMLTSAEITCGFVTTHVGYAEVPALLTRERIVEVIQLSHEAMLRIRGRAPKMLVCGLNPHAGEHGLFGNSEEERIIAPAVAAAQAIGIDIAGPFPPDTVFLRERRATTDCVICMYHDQGHIPLKALAFDVAVNITLGLPIIRTSVDHGTAFDIAWQGKAGVTSLIEAVRLASRLATEPAESCSPELGGLA
ncbi:4-hydroxythreonine-4-phosphate dehydrogenase PdxA [Blastopirellula marina]|uniref:Pyridoxal phosphate biosynthetic protein PdxA n=1 Tax=Blastopirellula marina DSM 3645 TaxID=314230 RepID=A3ZMC1_9BACT|nr:4-hydroxythreonine-4-phosphate dehydrogenase PdxA [Blastopirellula marina]EAQ82090.1 pyridoxal phosphate biosynthetic protein PdxA [Blastopirellula marina DSM 3645]